MLPRLLRSPLALPLLLLVACGEGPAKETGGTGSGAPASGGGFQTVRTADGVDVVVPPGVPRGPRLTFSDPILDFGSVSDTEEIHGAFPFTNTGSEPLVISEIKPSCGCTTVELARTRFEPGEGDSIELVWSPKGFGPQAKSITVQSNSDGEPITQLIIKAEIQPFARFQPSPLRPGPLQVGQEHRFELSLTCRDTGFEVLSVNANHPSVRVTAGERQGGTLPLEVVVGPEAPWGAFNTAIQVRLSGRPKPDEPPVEHTATVPVNLELFGDLQVRPTLFAVGHVLPGRTFSRKVELRRADGQPFQVTRAEVLNSQPPGMKVEAVVVDAGTEQGVSLVVSGEAGDYLGLVRATVRFETDIPGEEPRTLPVMGIVRE